MFSPENLDFQRRKLPAQAWLDDHHSVMFWSCFDQVLWSYLGNWGEGCGHLLLKLGGDYLQDKIQNDATDIIFDADFCFTWLCCFLTFKYGNALCSCPWNQLTGYLLLTSQSQCAVQLLHCNCWNCWDIHCHNMQLCWGTKACIIHLQRASYTLRPGSRKKNMYFSRSGWPKGTKNGQISWSLIIPWILC